MRSSRVIRWSVRAAAATLLLGIPACGEAGPTRGEVTGTVTLDGKSLDEGSIQFIPADGKSPTAGATILGGQYKTKAPVGEAKVAITGLGKVIGSYKDPASSNREIPITEEGVPARYHGATTPLRVTIEAGPNTHDFPLKTDKK